MKECKNKTRAAPTVQGFTPINKVPEMSNKRRSARLGADSTSKEPPPKKQRRQAPIKATTVTSTTTRSKKPSNRNATAPKNKPRTNIKAPTTSKGSILAGSSKSSALSTTTASKLNSMNLKVASPSVGKARLSTIPQEKASQKSLRRHDVDRTLATKNEHQRSDDTLSSDLWKDQQSLPNYPWLYSVDREEKSPADRPVSENDDQSESSTIFAQFFQSDTNVPTAQTEDTLMNDSELEDLLDDLEDRPSMKSRSVPEPVQGSSQIGKIDNGDEIFDVDDFTIDDSDLDVLMEATSSVEPGYTSIRSGSDSISPQRMVAQQQSNQAASRKSSTLSVKSAKTQEISDEDFDIDVDDFDGMVDLLEALPASPESKPIRSSIYQTPSPVKHASFATPTTVSPSTAPGSSPITGKANKDVHNRFVRPLHPAALQAPSPIPGVSPIKRVLTCFRVGEAINATAKAQRQGGKVFIELYARILHSSRAGPAQTFRIVDLWSSPDKLGVVLEGTWKGWEKSSLWQKDGEVFWRDGLRGPAANAADLMAVYARKCRLVGSLRHKADGGYTIEILSLWEAGWDDIEFAKGLVLGLQEKESIAA